MIFAICDCDAHRGPQKSRDFRDKRKQCRIAIYHLRVRWKVASDLRFRAAISEPKTASFCGISGDLAPSTRKSLAIAIVRFWCAKFNSKIWVTRGPVPVRLPAAAPGNHSGGFPCPEWVSATVAIRICDIVWLLVLALVLSVLCPWSLVKHKEWAK